MTTKV